MMKWKLEPDEVARDPLPDARHRGQTTWRRRTRRSSTTRCTCPKTLLEFTDADGAGMHCEMLNRSMANRRILDWLDETLGVD